MIFHKYKTIFIHVPKTGGTSIEDTFWPNSDTRTPDALWMGFARPFYNKYQTGGLQHLRAGQVLQEVGKEIFDSYYKFTIVRNPWDKAVSQYVYMGKRKDLRDFLGMAESDSFKKYLELIQEKEHVQWKKQVDFILDDDGEILVDDIFRLENISDAIGEISAKTGLHFANLPHKNKGDRTEYMNYYTPETKAMVGSLFREDIEFFGYSF